MYVQISSSYRQSSLCTGIHPLVIPLVQYFRYPDFSPQSGIYLFKPQPRFGAKFFWVMEPTFPFLSMFSAQTIARTFVRLQVVLQFHEILVEHPHFHSPSISTDYISASLTGFVLQD